ncbi:hypothetical protein J437_LFUL003464 [Ladona fulva]|uniref:Alpha-2-macroglobulin n=1 Tax=Ladona fulva TaxID=123851 RepID=A0A8K0JSE8_LADFU|nr:hypothetical protein J437_LFUL003464 [Ladona fulva]
MGVLLLCTLAAEDAGLLVISDAKLHTRPCVYSNVHIPNGCNPCPFRFGARQSIGGLPRRLSARRNRLKSASNHIVLAMSVDSPGEEVFEDRFDSAVLEESSTLGQPVSAYSPGSGRTPVVEVRSYFPETWLWDLVHINESGIVELEHTTPHTITEWIGHATCLSTKTGLGTSSPANLNVFQPFFVEATMPYSVKRGELLRLKVSVFNFLSHGLPVRVSVSESSGMEIIENNTYTYCIEDKGTVVPEFSLKMTELGEINITVSAEVDEMFPESCGPEMLLSRRDVMIKPILVKPEGFPVEKTQSSFICASESEDVILYWNLELPSDLVEGSARAEFSAVGDMLGPSLENLDSLVQLPVGCGEQNMVLLVPNIHVLDYLESTDQINPELRSKAILNMEKGYQRQLNYRHEDGSYSAFGKYDPEGSMWLTAFVIKSFAQARKFIFIDDNDLKVSVRWIIKRQMENGCFPFVGKVFHKDLKGGLSGETSSVAFTAYILTALLETGVEMAPSVLTNALYCLKAEDKEPSQTSDMYTLALTTYALTLTNETERAQQSLNELLEMSTREKDLLWWNKPGSKSLGMNIEITAYAILSLVKIGGEDNLIHAFQAVRWISQQRNSHGGFVSTQDTVVALEALTKYATVFMNNGNDKNANLSINMKTVDYDNTYVINDEVRLLLHHNEIPTLPTGVDVKATGKGCALVQTSLKYNVKTPKGSDAFDVIVETSPSMDSCSVQNLRICTRYKLTDEKSNMAIMEIDMISGYVPLKDSLEKLKLNPLLNLKRWEVDKNQVNLYFDELSSTKICVNFLVQQDAKVENPKPATVTVYDYYQQELFVSTDYNFPENCVIEVLPELPPIDPILKDAVDEPIQIDGEPVPLNLQEMKAATVEVGGSKGVLRVNSSSIPVGLNPAFVNVDHDLEFPDGIEGPSPVYTSPQADSSRHHQERDECPLCLDSVPDNFAKIYCSSRNAYKVSVRKFLNAKILMTLSPGRRTRKFNKPIIFDVKKSCSCIQIHKAGSHILVLNLDDRGFNDEKPHVRLGSSTMVIPIPQSPGQPSTVRSARSTCK